MIAQSRIDQDVKPVGLDWITALRDPTNRKLTLHRHIQLSLFDSQDISAAACPDFPGERLLSCDNPVVAADYSASKFDRDEFDRRPGRLRRCKMVKHLEWTLDEQTDALSSTRKWESIPGEERLDDINLIRTSPSEKTQGDREVQHAFRSLKTVLLKVRSSCQWRERRVWAHLFVCLLAYFPEWRLRRRLAPLLWAKEGEPEPGASPVARAGRLPAAKRTGRTGLPLQSLRDLLASLSTLTAVELVYKQVPGYAMPPPGAMLDLQRWASELLGLQPHLAPSMASPSAVGGPPAAAPA